MKDNCQHCAPDKRGVSRRRLLGYGLGGFLGFAAARQSDLFGAPALNMFVPQDGPGATRASAKACIVLWLAGGPATLDMWDPKEGVDNGGPTKGIETNVSGIKLAENMAKTAKVMDKIAVVRSMTSREGSHERARYLMHTGYVPTGTVVHPSMGSIAAMEVGNKNLELPNFMSINSPTEGAGFLSPEYSPFVVDRAGQPIKNLNLPQGVDDKRFRDRMNLLASHEKEFGANHACDEIERHKNAYDKADKLMHTPLLRAFDLTKEKAELKKSYGENNFGLGCLLARRLVQEGVRFVEVNLGGWDTHQDNFNRIKQLTGTLDPGVATLVKDLDQIGMLKDTLVVCMGEFGRTPKINKDNGRDHYPKAWSMMIAGGGIQGGRVIGSTDKDGVDVKDRPVTVPDLLATIYTTMGVNIEKKNISPLGRPIKIVDNGVAVKELLS